MWKRVLLLFLVCFFGLAILLGSTGPLESGSYTVASPDRRISVTVSTGSELAYSISVDGRQILKPSPISMMLASGKILGKPATPTSSKTQSVNRILRPVLRIKRAEVRDSYNEVCIDFSGDFSLVVRVFNDGTAYRFVTALSGEITITDEQSTYRFVEDGLVYFPEEESLMSHQERLYVKARICEIKSPRFSSLPALVKLSDGLNVVITESDLLDYAGMDLTVDGEPNSLRGLFPGYPIKVHLKGDRDEEVTKRAYSAPNSGNLSCWHVATVKTGI
jgi:alpha-glucosidase